jgi:RNA polymerase sigma-70 factor (ECF subfamily)
MAMPRPGLVVSIGKARRGQGALVREAIPAYLDELYRFALRLTRYADGAQDLVQECVLRALKAQNTVVRDPRTWLYQTLYHIFIDRNRRGACRETPDEDSDQSELEGVVDPVPSLIALEDVRNAVESLPEGFRAVVWLSDAEQFPLREIAEILGCPLGTVASRLARGRQELRRLLSAYGPPGEKSP